MRYSGRISVNGLAAGPSRSNNLNQLIKDLRRLAEYNNPSFYFDNVTIEVWDKNGLEMYFGRKKRCCKRFSTVEL